MKTDTDGVVVTADKPSRGLALPKVTLPKRLRKGAGSGSTAAEGKLYGPSPRRLTWGAAALGLVILVPVGVAAVTVAESRELARQNGEVLAAVSGIAAGSAPGGFAERCVELWLRAGATEREKATLSPAAVEDPTASFLDNCNPGVSAADLKGQLPNMVQATSVHAEDSGLSYPDPLVAGLWSVTVGASVSAFQPGQTPDSAEFERLDVLYYRVSVLVDPKTHLASLRGLPRQVAAPVASDVPGLSISLSDADLNEPRTALIQSYLSASLPAPAVGREAEGDVSRFFLPGVVAVPVHSPSVESVLVTRVGFRVREDGTVDALARVLVTHQGGTSVVQEFSFLIAQEGARWSIAGLPGSPLLDVSSKAVSSS